MCVASYSSPPRREHRTRLHGDIARDPTPRNILASPSRGQKSGLTLPIPWYRTPPGSMSGICTGDVYRTVASANTAPPPVHRTRRSNGSSASCFSRAMSSPVSKKQPRVDKRAYACARLLFCASPDTGARRRGRVNDLWMALVSHDPRNERSHHPGCPGSE